MKQGKILALLGIAGSLALAAVIAWVNRPYSPRIHTVTGTDGSMNVVRQWRSINFLPMTDWGLDRSVGYGRIAGGEERKVFTRLGFLLVVDSQETTETRSE